MPGATSIVFSRVECVLCAIDGNCTDRMRVGMMVGKVSEPERILD
jgi:hypothetical protein